MGLKGHPNNKHNVGCSALAFGYEIREYIWQNQHKGINYKLHQRYISFIYVCVKLYPWNWTVKQQLHQKQISDLASHLIFHPFSPFTCCFVAWQKEITPKTCRVCVFVLINRVLLNLLMCLDRIPVNLGRLTASGTQSLYRDKATTKWTTVSSVGRTQAAVYSRESSLERDVREWVDPAP